MTHDFKIENAGIEDFDLLATLDAVDDGAQWTIGMFGEEFERPQSILRVARSNVSIAGFIVMANYGDEWTLMNIFVEPTFRRQGIARQLLEDAIVGVGDQSITLEVRSTSLGAIALYESCGFRSEGTRPKYYPLGVDAIIMRRKAKARA